MSEKAMHKISTTFVCVISSIFLIGCCCFGDKLVGAKGIVRDKTGSALEGVIVTLEAENQMGRNSTTDSNGEYKIYFIGGEAKQTRISFRKNGYKIFEKQLERNDLVDLDATLEPESK